VVGLGHISQVVLLPAFKNAKNSELAALVSDDAQKRKELAKRYRLNPASTYSYEEYEQCLTQRATSGQLGDLSIFSSVFSKRSSNISPAASCGTAIRSHPVSRNSRTFAWCKRF
jgi:hypothetical protein